jgi:hypothetical protein
MISILNHVNQNISNIKGRHSKYTSTHVLGLGGDEGAKNLPIPRRPKMKLLQHLRYNSKNIFETELNKQKNSIF